jgi:hypothetical protein
VERGTIFTGRFQHGLASGDSGLQLNLEIALSGVSAKVKPFNRFQAGRKCVEASGNVIQNIFTITPASRIWDFSPMRLGSRNRRQGDRRNRQMFFEAPEVEPVFSEKD